MFSDILEGALQELRKLSWERRLDPCEPGSREILLRWHFSFQERKLAGLLA